MNLIKINILLLSFLCVSAAVFGQDEAPVAQRSLGLNVVQVAQGQFPNFLYQKRVGNRTRRLGGGLGFSQQSRIMEENDCETITKSKSFAISPSISYGTVWEWGRDWIAFYTGPEVSLGYSFNRARSYSDLLDCDTGVESYSESITKDHTLRLGVGAVLGLRCQLSNRFSINLESSLQASGSISRTYGFQEEGNSVSGLTSSNESSALRDPNVGVQALPTTKLFLNFHF